MDLTASLVGALPKVALHDHLDGGLRAETVLELSQELGLEVPGLEAPLDEAPDAEDASGRPPGDVTADAPAADAPAADVPSTDAPAADVPSTDAPTADAPPADAARAVADWFHSAADSGSLPAYLSTFERTVAVMQTAPQLRRVAREFVEDMVADGVVYAETRWAPHQHTAGGLSLDEAVQAVQDGLDEGVAAAEAAGRRIVVGQLLCYLRHLDPTDDLFEIALARRDSGVVGLDLAGPEEGFPASWFRAQFERARAAGLRVTVHAGEADGPSSIADALDCGAERIGHGVRLLEDISDAPDGMPSDSMASEVATDMGSDMSSEAASEETSDEEPTPSPTFGGVADRVLREQICLEVCPSSNLQTGVADELSHHPVGPLHRLGFALALSSDNRLMSRTSTSREMLRAAQTFGWTLEDLERIVLTGLENGFAPAAQRQALRDEVVLPIFRAVRGPVPTE